MNKLFVWILVTVISSFSSILFAQDLATATYLNFKDYPAPHGSPEISPGTPIYTYPYDDTFTFKNFPNPQTPAAMPAPDALMWHVKVSSMPSCPSKV